jgi:S1-C subfamily serine protease
MGHNRGMRADGRGETSESGFGHIVVAAVVVVVAIVVLVALADSARTSSAKRARVPSSPPVASGTPRSIDAEAVARAVGPAVVDLDVSLANGGHVSATGMVLTPAGEVVTSNHSIAQATAIVARTAGRGRTYAATVLGYDRTADVAVLSLVGASGLATIEPADSSALGVGDPVVAIGSVAGVAGVPTPLTGTVTARDRRVEAGAETLDGMDALDVLTRTGDSGGPVSDASAKVVAMITSAPGGGRFREQTREDATFAMPIDDVLAVVDRVDAGQNTSSVHVGPTAALGVVVRPTLPDGGAGAYVVSVQGDGPAARAGIVADTIIVSIDDATIPTIGVLDATLDRYRPGDVVRVGWVDRDGVYRTRAVRLGSGVPA